MRTWSLMQQAVFANVATGKGHTVVLARAGSGKTTTIVEALNHVPAGKSVAFVAFNREIANELKTRAPGHVEVCTLHSLGLKTLTKAWGRVRVDENRTKDIIAEALPLPPYEEREAREACFERRGSLRRLVSLAKGCLADTPEALADLLDQYQIVPPYGAEERPEFLATAMGVLDACRTRRGSIDFDDMVWLPVVCNLAVRTFDRVFVDETQDLNAAQIALALRACKKTGRICAVGDDRQAIYGFRGADHAAVGRVVTALKAPVLPLSVTYRCDRAITRIASQVVPDFTCPPEAAEGFVGGCNENGMVVGAKPGDFILSRVNAPLMSLCMRFLREGRRAAIQGRDVGERLAGLVKKAKATTVDALTAWVTEWARTECARLEKDEKDTTSVEDTAACLLTLCEGCTTPAEVLTQIQTLFADGDDASRIVLSSTHKAKGLERDRVWLLLDTYCRTVRKDKPMSEAQIREEENLYYVAVTRARHELWMVTAKGAELPS